MSGCSPFSNCRIQLEIWMKVSIPIPYHLPYLFSQISINVALAEYITFEESVHLNEVIPE